VIYALQILRGIAATLVVYAHAHDFAKELSPARSYQIDFFHLEDFGAIGVDIFFVISGIIITLSANGIRSVTDANAFAAKRFLRVAPFYWFLSIASAISALWEFDQLQKLSADAFIATFLFYPVKAAPIIFIGWTLCFEMLFYLAMYLFQISRFAANGLRLAVAVVLTAIVILILPSASLGGFFLNPIILEFAFGVAIAGAYLAGATLNRQQAIATVCAGTSLALLSMIVGYGDIAVAERTLSGENSALRVLVWGVPAALIALGTLHFRIADKTSSRFVGALIVVGDASYSIYLVHPFAIGALRRSSIATVMPPDVLILVLTMLGVLAGYVAFRLLEQPIRRANKKIVDWLFEKPLADNDKVPIMQPSPQASE
jgi:peptidoglycan/LPS O-acetylase OafA/YrhL